MVLDDQEFHRAEQRGHKASAIQTGWRQEMNPSLQNPCVDELSNNSPLFSPVQTGLGLNWTKVLICSNTSSFFFVDSSHENRQHWKNKTESMRIIATYLSLGF